MGRLVPWALAFTYATLPLFPSFIALTPVSFPGISLVSQTFALVLFAVISLVAIYAVIALATPPYVPQPLLVPLLVWLGAALLSGTLGFDPRAGLLFDLIFGFGILWHCALLRYYEEPGVARATFVAYLGSGTLAAAAAIAMVVTRRPPELYAIGHGRAVGTFVLPGELAGYLIVFLPIAYAVARIASERWLRALAIAAACVGAIALAMTFSRAGWMGLAAAAAFFVAVRARGSRRTWAVVAALAVAALLAASLVFNAHHDPSENYTRLAIWQAALSMVNRFPLTGVGPFGFSHVYAVVRLPDGEPVAFHAHSVYLTFLAETGLVGFSAFVWTCWRFARELVDRLKTATPDGALLAWAATAGLVGTLVQGAIDTVTVVIFGLWLATMGLALVAARSGLPGERG